MARGFGFHSTAAEVIDDRMLATGSSDGTVRLFDLQRVLAFVC